MKIVFKETTNKMDSQSKEVVPLFKVQEGMAKQSFGLSCAAHAGMPGDVIERAAYITQCFQEGTPIAPWFDGVKKEENTVLLRTVHKLVEATQSSSQSDQHQCLQEAWSVLKELEDLHLLRSLN